MTGVRPFFWIVGLIVSTLAFVLSGGPPLTYVVLFGLMTVCFTMAVRTRDR